MSKSDNPFNVSQPEYWQHRLDSISNQDELYRVVFDTNRETWNSIQEAHRKTLAELVKPGMRILDAGCGIGSLIGILPGSITSYVGVDIADCSLAIARKQYPQHRFLKLDLRDLSMFRDKEFDLCVARSLEGPIKFDVGFSEWLKMWNEMRRVSKSVLTLCYTTPEYWDIVNDNLMPSIESTSIPSSDAGFIYEPGQVSAIFPYITQDISMFVLGGPADGNEAQVFAQRYPHIPILGFEPNAAYFDHQQKIGFPGTLLPKALWNCSDECNFYLLGDGFGRSSRLIPRKGDQTSYRVKTISLDDALPGLRHPSRIALWIDIEGSELRALQGAQRLLTKRLIRVIYLECYEDTIDEITDHLAKFSLREVVRVNQHEVCDDAGVMRRGRFDAIFTL